jgi:hypothetical protein
VDVVAVAGISFAGSLFCKVRAGIGEF